MKKTTKKTNSKPRSLVIKRLENVSKDLFRKHFDLITDLVGSSHGIYALYDSNELYYVGKSSDLRKRVKHHLRDRHYASWTHFSLYLVRNAEHIHEIESLLIRISNPKGNRIKPKGRSSGAMLRELKKMVKQKQGEEFRDMFGSTSQKKSKKAGSSLHPKSLVGLVKHKATLYRTYKGKEYKAILTAKGIIKLGNKTFTSLSGAAVAIVGRAANGWKFWYIKNTSGEWVRLGEYRQ